MNETSDSIFFNFTRNRSLGKLLQSSDFMHSRAEMIDDGKRARKAASPIWPFKMLRLVYCVPINSSCLHISSLQQKLILKSYISLLSAEQVFCCFHFASDLKRQLFEIKYFFMSDENFLLAAKKNILRISFIRERLDVLFAS